MNLGELIHRLKKVTDRSKVLKVGLGSPHSYRGYYDQLAFEPLRDISIQQMLDEAKACLGETFTGYKGGEFTMCEETTVNVAHYGSCGEEIGPMLLGLMLGEYDRIEFAD